jgi:hypothetical protein
VLGLDFVADYTTDLLPAVAGVPSGYGGVTFKAGNPNKLLIIGGTATSTATIYEVDVTRDAAGYVDGFVGPATALATAPFADGGLGYASGGVLLYTTWPSNTLGQIKPGSASADRIVDLTALGVSSSTGGLAVTPNGFPGAGSLRLTSYSSSDWYSADLVPDGMGTFDLANVVLRASLAPAGAGPEGFAYVDANPPAFASQSVLVCNWNSSSVGAYGLDGAGDVDPNARRDFFTAFQCSGATVDPMTGAFVFSRYAGTSILVVKLLNGTLGTSYCVPAVNNSTGNPSVLTAAGSRTASANDVTLTAAHVPTNAFGFFLTSRTQGLVVGPGGSQGNLCLAGSIGRYVGPGQIQNSGAAGSFSLVLNLTQTPTPTGLVGIVSGETWNFQGWHRDAVGGMATSNFTNGVSVAFQ